MERGRRGPCRAVRGRAHSGRSQAREVGAFACLLLVCLFACLLLVCSALPCEPRRLDALEWPCWTPQYSRAIPVDLRMANDKQTPKAKVFTEEEVGKVGSAWM